jgi:predicted ATPase
MQIHTITSTGEFVGREPELTLARARLDAAIAGSAGVLLLAGEPGIGKTRLAEELAVEARARGCRVLWGRCWDGEGAPAFWPWVQIIRAHLRDGDPSGLHGELGTGAAAIAQIVPEVRDHLEEIPPPPPLEPAQARFRLFDDIAAFLTNLAHRQPLVLILDDLHVADLPSLLLLRFLGQSLGLGSCGGATAARVLVVGAYRDTDLGREQQLTHTLTDLAREPHVQRLELNGLDQED